MGDALTEINCSRHSLGYAGLIDSENTHQKRMGNSTVVRPKMPVQPPHQGDKTDKDVRRVCKNKFKCCLACKQVHPAGVKTLEVKCPGFLELLCKEESGMLLEDKTLIECMEHIINAVDTVHAKQEIPLQLQKEIQDKANDCQHVGGANSCIPFFKQMGAVKTNIDALDLKNRKLPVEELTMHCQQGLRGGVGDKKEAIASLNEKWKSKPAVLQKGVTKDNKIWPEFKIFCTKGIRQKEETMNLLLCHHTGKQNQQWLKKSDFCVSN